MSTIQRFGSNARLSEAVTANGFVFLAGMVPEKTDGNIIEQTADVLRQIDEWLEKCGSSKSHILEATIYLPNMDDYDGMNIAWDEWVDTSNSPARACVEAKLAKSEWKVEIKISAVQK
ncbi:RidA family protein [Neisseriaceae bacterium B1]